MPAPRLRQGRAAKENRGALVQQVPGKTHAQLPRRTRMTTLDPRIGMLASERFYAFSQGYDQEPVMGTLQQVNEALGLATGAAPSAAAPAGVTSLQTAFKTYVVKVTFEFPAWDEVLGLDYPGITAKSKTEANNKARALARNDGHLCSGRGHVYFRATEATTGGE